ncbi:ABC transporter permease [Haloarchaeobius sp. DT45]|uniref:ABC transporter permease n=1 Tax=Haloarchaeobius sp. DT45 TaxID=3446116 RepID=UPI003F6BC9CD
MAATSPLHGTVAVASRLLLSLRGDRRTLGLVVVVPAFVIWLFSEVFPQQALGDVAPVLLAVFVFMLTYMLTAIGFLRERTAGTLERVLVSPASRAGIVLGYVLGFGVLAVVQSGVLLAAAVYFLDVTFAHGLELVVLIEVLGALTALGIGVVLSLFAENEFQAIQFIPIVITPQVILGGTFAPVETLPDYLEVVARVVPLTYMIDGMRYVLLDDGTSGEFWVAVAVLLAWTLASVLVAAVVIRRA